MTVVELVERERRGVRRALLVWGGALALAALALVLGLGVATLGRSRWIALPAATPFVVWLLALGAAAAVALAARRRWRRDASSATVAAAIEQERALRAGALRGVMEVSAGGALARLAADRLGARLAGEGPVLAPAHRRRAHAAAGITSGGALVALLLLAAATSLAPDGWAAVAHPVRAWRGALLPAITIDAPAQVLRGTTAKVEIAAPGRREVTVRVRATGAAWRERAHALDADGAAVVDLGAVDADLTVIASDGRGESPTVTIRVTDRPFVGDVSLHATYPAYLERAAETLPAGEPLRVPRGTMLAVTGRASTALTAIALGSGRDTIRLSPDAHRFSGRFVAERGGRYAWVARSAGGPVRDVPGPLELEVVPDTAPRVEILSPTRDTLVAAGDRIRLVVAATDDHGLAGVSLRSWKVPAGAPTGTRQAESAVALTGAASVQWSGDGTLDLGARGLQPGDALHVVAVATDASPWRQAGTSRVLVLKVPSLSEQRDVARDAADSTVQQAVRAAREQRSLQQRTAESSRARDRGSRRQGQEGGAQARGSQQSMSFESAEQARQLAQEQRQLAERVRDLEQSARQLERQLRQAGALDSALTSRLREVQQLLAQALTPELAAQLQRLEENARNLEGDQARQAMGDLAEMQRRLRETLEKSVEMLRRAALEGAMQTLRDEAKELAEAQRALADSLAGRRPRADSAASGESAQDLARRSDALQEDVQQLAERLDRERARAGADNVRRAEQHVERSANAMERAAEQQRSAQQQAGQQQAGQQQAGQQQAGQQQAGQQQTGQQQAGQQQAGQQQAGQQQAGQQQSGQQSGQQQSGQQGARQNAAEQAANEMQQAAQQLAQAREQQIGEWKEELTQELDRAVQEMLQMAREQDRLAQQAQQGAEGAPLRAQQNALQQGVERAGERLQQAGQRSSLLSQRSQRQVGEARQKVQQATQQLAENQGRGQQAASSMRDAAASLNQAAASLVRDRERANQAQSASGFAEMVQQMQEAARQQGQLNQQAQGLQISPSGQMSDQARAAARALGRQQRRVAERLDDAAGGDESGRAEEMAREARQLAQQMERGAVDQATIERQQRLYRRLLDAGMTMEQDERDDQGRREARAGRQDDPFAPANADAAGRDAARFRAPTWEELRGLSAEERRLVLEYFRRINGRQ